MQRLAGVGEVFPYEVHAPGVSEWRDKQETAQTSFFLGCARSGMRTGVELQAARLFAVEPFPMGGAKTERLNHHKVEPDCL